MLMVVCGASFAAALGLVLFAPLDFEARLERPGPHAKPVWAVTLRGLMGLVSLRFCNADFSAARVARKPLTRARRRWRWTAFLAPDLLERAAASAARLQRVIRVRHCAVYGRFGFDDPADTGRLWGMVFPLLALFGSSSRSEVDLQPDFGQEAIWGRLVVSIRVQIVQILSAALPLVSSWELWRAVRKGWRGAK